MFTRLWALFPRYWSLFDQCVCFELLFTSDDNLGVRLFYRTRRSPLQTLQTYLFLQTDAWSQAFTATPHAYKRSGTQPEDCLSHSPFHQMFVRAAAERSLSGTPMHLLFVDAPNCAISIDRVFHARLEPLRAFVSSYPMDGILRAYEKCSRPINGILSDTASAFTDQPRLCCRKHHSLQHHPCFRAMIHLQPHIRRPQCYSSRATSTPVTLLPTAGATPYFLRASDPSANFFARPSARTFPFLLDLDVRETFFCRPPSRVLFSGILQYQPFLDNFNTVWPSGDLYHSVHIFPGGLFLLGPYSPLQI